MTHEHQGHLELVVAVLTYKRPEDLAAALPLLIDQIERCPVPGYLLVVDNDPEASATTAVDRWSHRGVRYTHEPRPGIAAARNRAIDEAKANLLVFIDDDERPSSGWLTALVHTYRIDKPLGVVGPVLSEYAHEPDPWISAGRFFDRRRLRSGTSVDVAATNNLMLDLYQLKALGLRFDESFGLSGGSDTLFTRDAVRRGGRIVWCDEAWVVDIVPPQRLTRQWVLRRALRSGNSWSRTTIALEAARPLRLGIRFGLFGSGLIRLAGGSALLGWGLVTASLSRRARGARAMARGVGMASGACGYVYVEYTRARESE